MRNVLVAGIAAAAVGVSGVALAQTPQIHVMTVALPGGGLAQIRYTGNVAPRVTFSTAPSPLDVWAPLPALFGSDSPFAALDRISAEMDRQAAAMFRRAEALSAVAQPGRLTAAALRSLPPGSSSYTFVSTMSGNGVCSESVEITSPGNGAPPRVVRHSSGNCAALPGGAGAVNLPAVAPPAQAGTVWTSAPAPDATPVPAARQDAVWTAAHGAKPYAGLVREIPPAQR